MRLNFRYNEPGQLGNSGENKILMSKFSKDILGLRILWEGKLDWTNDRINHFKEKFEPC